MEIQGNVMEVGAVQSGTSTNGNAWKKQEVVVEFFEFPTDMWTQKIVVTLLGHNVDEYHLNVGDKVSVRFGLNTNEWKGRYFQEIRLAKDGLKVLSRLGEPTNVKAEEPKPQPQAQPQPTEQADGLPF